MGKTPHRLLEPRIGQVSVSHGHPRIGMAQERLRGSQVAKAHLDVAGEGVPKVVEAEAGDLHKLGETQWSSTNVSTSILELRKPASMVANVTAKKAGTRQRSELSPGLP